MVISHFSLSFHKVRGLIYTHSALIITEELEKKNDNWYLFWLWTMNTRFLCLCKFFVWLIDFEGKEGGGTEDCHMEKSFCTQSPCTLWTKGSTVTTKKILDFVFSTTYWLCTNFHVTNEMSITSIVILNFIFFAVHSIV